MSKTAGMIEQIQTRLNALLAAAFEPVAARLQALETKLAALPAPQQGERGPQGERGEPAAPVDMDALKTFMAEQIKVQMAALPPAMPGRDGRDGQRGEDGRDGAAGKDGADGFNLEDFSAETSEDGRTLTLKFERGTLTREFNLKLRAPIYCGIWQEGEHKQDDIVTLSGSAWIATRETSERPGTPGVDTGWRLMVKEGRPGKDGVLKPAPEHKPVRTA